MQTLFQCRVFEQLSCYQDSALCHGCNNIASFNKYLATRAQCWAQIYQCQVLEVLSYHQGTMLHQGCDNVTSLNNYLAARMQHCAKVVIMLGFLTTILQPWHNVVTSLYQCQVFEVLSYHQGTMLCQGSINVRYLNNHRTARAQHCALVVSISGLGPTKLQPGCNIVLTLYKC